MHGFLSFEAYEHRDDHQSSLYCTYIWVCFVYMCLCVNFDTVNLCLLYLLIFGAHFLCTHLTH